MPDVGLTTATEPVNPDYPVIIKYSVEVDGLPVYTETYDVEKLADEWKQDATKVAHLWLRRLQCVLAARHRPAFSATLTKCLAEGVITSNDV